MSEGRRRRVVIVGGGFGGLNAAKVLGKADKVLGKAVKVLGKADKALGKATRDVEVVLIDVRNHHLFQPLLYQVAMAGLSPADIAAPIRSLLRHFTNTTVVQGRVSEVDFDARRVRGDFGEREYDYLILAAGAQHAYFGHDEWEPFAPGLKTIEQATEIRRRVLTAFERAENNADPGAERKRWLSFVIVGAGPTGVELAGAIAEMSRTTLARDFRNIDPKSTRVILVEGGPRVLPTFSPESADRARRDLEELGVQIWTDSTVTRVDAQGVEIGGERIEAGTVLWAAGVRAAPLAATLPVERDRANRLHVGADLALPDHPEVFAVGDFAWVDGPNGRPLPGLAPVAMQAGRFAAQAILADLRGQPRGAFRYRDKGQMATIGRRRAVAEMPSGLRFSGFLAWAAWLLVHVYYLTGFPRRVLVLFQWAWSYLTFARGARLIVGKSWRLYAPEPEPKPEPEPEPEQEARGER